MRLAACHQDSVFSVAVAGGMGLDLLSVLIDGAAVADDAPACQIFYIFRQRFKSHFVPHSIVIEIIFG